VYYYYEYRIVIERESEAKACFYLHPRVVTTSVCGGSRRGIATAV
jgi:hypothetical protein